MLFSWYKLWSKELYTSMGLVNAIFPTTADLYNQELMRTLLVQPTVFG